MAEALVSIAVDQLSSIVKEEVELATDVKNEARKLKDKLESIKAVLDDAEMKQLTDAALRVWLDKLKDKSYDIDDMLDEWKTSKAKLQMKKAKNFDSRPKVRRVIAFHLSCYYKPQALRLRHAIAHKIRAANDRLVEIDANRQAFSLANTSTSAKGNSLRREIGGHIMTTSSMDEAKIHGRDDEKKELLECLLSESLPKQSNPPIISIVGMGGIGKTTLAQLVYNDDKVTRNFYKRAWVCVSDPWDQTRVAKEILESLQGRAPDVNELPTVLQKIQDIIEKKSLLLVLDDVWPHDPRYHEQLITALKCVSELVRILITTRDENVAQKMGAIKQIDLKPLKDNEPWLFFSQIAFSGERDENRREFEDVGRQIVDKCKGLPLAIKSLASLLRSKDTKKEWQDILKSEILQSGEIKNEVFRPLLLSYHDLEPSIRKCFLYCVIFPKDFVMEKGDVIRLWMAQGYIKDEKESKEMEKVGEEYIKILVKRSFFQDFRHHSDCEYFKMHDIVHDLAQSLTENECLNVESSNPKLKDFPEETRHLTITIRATNFLPVTTIPKMRKLHTFFIISEIEKSSEFLEEFLPQLLSQSTCLRTLIISCKNDAFVLFDVGKGLDGIDKQMHLRFIKFSGCQFQELPEAICELYNLQTLDDRGCWHHGFPSGVGKLINLRYSPEPWKPIIFRVSKRTVHEVQRNLNRLMRYDLFDGKDLRFVFIFKNDKQDEALLNSLVLPPSSNSFELEISMYGSKRIKPATNWLHFLSDLTLYRCKSCERLPPLGNLSSLAYLEIIGMLSVKKVGDEFLGVEGQDHGGNITFFPKLEYLKFDDLVEWEDWEYDVTKRRGDDIKIMPCLIYLDIFNCPKLKALPHDFKCHLAVSDCPILEESV